MVKYSQFPDMLYNVRFEIAMSEMMEYNIDNMGYEILGEFRKEDPQGTRQISVNACQQALQRCKKVNLTPF